MVAVGIGESVTDTNFGNRPTSLGAASGTVWNDANADGIRFAEASLGGWAVYSDLNRDLVLNNPVSGDGVCDESAAEPCDVTSNQGQYSLSLGPGITHNIFQIVEPGWQQTFPNTGGSLEGLIEALNADNAVST